VCECDQAKDPTLWKVIAVFHQRTSYPLVVHSSIMQLFTEEGWSIVINKKRIGLLVVVEGNGPALINEIIR
jgi:hypothetical protein